MMLAKAAHEGKSPLELAVEEQQMRKRISDPFVGMTKEELTALMELQEKIDQQLTISEFGMMSSKKLRLKREAHRITTVFEAVTGDPLGAFMFQGARSLGATEQQAAAVSRHADAVYGLAGAAARTTGKFRMSGKPGPAFPDPIPLKRPKGKSLTEGEIQMRQLETGQRDLGSIDWARQVSPEKGLSSRGESRLESRLESRMSSPRGLRTPRNVRRDRPTGMREVRMKQQELEDMLQEYRQKGILGTR